MALIRRAGCDGEHDQGHQRAGQVDERLNGIGQQADRACQEIGSGLERHRGDRCANRQPGKACQERPVLHLVIVFGLLVWHASIILAGLPLENG